MVPREGERGESERGRGEKREGRGWRGCMRGFQKGITLGGRTSANFYLMGLQNRVAKKFAKFLHLSVDLSRGS